MEKSLSKETKVLCLIGGVDIPISEEEEIAIKEVFKRKLDYIEFKGMFLTRQSIQYIVPAVVAEEKMIIRRGYVKCEKNHWYSRKLLKCDKCYW